MLKTIFVLIFTSSVMYAAYIDKKPIFIDWGFFSKKPKPEQPLITYASGHFSYILQATPKTDPIALSIAHGRIHLLCAYHLRNHTEIKNTANFISLWRPLEQFMQEYTPDLQIALAYYADNKLLSVLRGYCGLYHWHNDTYTQPACAESVQTDMRSFKEMEYVSLCGVSPWKTDDAVFLFTNYLDNRLCPYSTLPWIQSKYTDSSASTKAHILPLHVYAPRIQLTVERNKVIAEKRIQENCACIVAKKQKI